MCAPIFELPYYKGTMYEIEEYVTNFTFLSQKAANTPNTVCPK